MTTPSAFLITGTGLQPGVMLDHARAVEHAAWKNATVTPLVPEHLLTAAHARIAELERKLILLGPEDEGI